MDIIVWKKPNQSAVFTFMISTDVDTATEIQKIKATFPDWEDVIVSPRENLNATFDLFITAYEFDDQLNLVHNMERARNIWKNKLSIDINNHIKKLNDELIAVTQIENQERILEIENTKANLLSLDLDTEIAQAQTTLELKQVYPNIPRL